MLVNETSNISSSLLLLPHWMDCFYY